ncbi:unnamed protein product [Blepharisma stoltei]|uniref:ABC-2 type transporter transmembrane domain-containing protein n=1 Tax=Blepharisma stoltei TaxID=1481888 RepID=A0AAU9IG41_9CILI|nr:unnamed protein product [Blepharisma stoltei]
MQNTNGVLYMISIWAIMSGNHAVIMNYYVERAVFLKEHDEGLYGTWSYFLSKNIVDLPWTFVAGFLTSVIAYFSLDLNLHDESKFVIFYCIYVMALQCGMAFGYITGYMMSSVETALAFSTVILFPITAFGGQHVKVTSIPIAWRWITYITPFKWVFQAFTVNEYNDWERDCDTKCDPLGRLGWSDELWQGPAGIIVLSTCVRLLAFFLLKLQTRNKRS